MRNFWLEADIDGRETLVTGGPRSKDGGMNVEISMRDGGCSVTACTIHCYEYNGLLCVTVRDTDGNIVYARNSHR